MHQTPTPSERVRQIVYLSRATMYVDRVEMNAIISTSSTKNRRLHVTGALLFCGAYFLQILEGEPDVLSKLLATIEQDSRHTDVQILEQRDGVPRAFADWAMASLHEDTLTDEQSVRARACLERINNRTLAVPADAYELLAEFRGAIADSQLARVA